MKVDGRLDIVVAGERWIPMPTLDKCGPDDPCYVIRIADDGSATVEFGDGATGRRPPEGGRIEVAYGGGDAHGGNVDNHDSGIALIDLYRDIGDLLSQYQAQVASEAHLETGGGRRPVSGPTDLEHAIAGQHGPLTLCVCLMPRPRRRRRTDRA